MLFVGVTTVRWVCCVMTRPFGSPDGMRIVAPPTTVVKRRSGTAGDRYSSAGFRGRTWSTLKRPRRGSERPLALARAPAQRRARPGGRRRAPCLPPRTPPRAASARAGSRRGAGGPASRAGRRRVPAGLGDRLLRASVSSSPSLRSASRARSRPARSSTISASCRSSRGRRRSRSAGRARDVQRRAGRASPPPSATCPRMSG